MIPGISIIEILTLTSILFFIGIYGFMTRTNLISMLISVEIILNSTVINFVIINKYLYPELLQGVVYAIFIIAVAAAETALAVAIIINLYKQISSVAVKETETLKY
ncbi:NADH-quinone oxidoreductase subunit NuoK [Salegentibacter sp.]|uniref:NADH-quinone oxidoreductase subunit NuoK n=1 Tax=Salegentibacter sp. TaxID=1903072 RepID=UPI003562C17C